MDRRWTWLRPLLIYLLMAGEIYTTFSFLGAGGWAYSRGGPTLYILAYLTLGNIVGFFILPHIWEMGRQHGLQTQPDFSTFATAASIWRLSSLSLESFS
jgi:Na+/proline symporter